MSWCNCFRDGLQHCKGHVTFDPKHWGYHVFCSVCNELVLRGVMGQRLGACGVAYPEHGINASAGGWYYPAVPECEKPKHLYRFCVDATEKELQALGYACKNCEKSK